MRPRLSSANGRSRSDCSNFKCCTASPLPLQERLAREGYRVRRYVPYGRMWYPYFVRRLAERPANVWFIIKNW
ncbi:hypothetical protein LJK87_16885 [Paenibacillus sp. P25]|nr:hypothetical protein LJK87_16885 [Paenibacillus sp. P25]